MNSYNRFCAALAVPAIFAIVPPAFSQAESGAVYQRLTEQLALQGIIVESADVSAQGDDIILQNARFQLEGEDDILEIGTIELLNISGSDADGYTIGTIVTPQINIDEDDTTVSFGGVEITDYFVASANEGDPVLRAGVFSKADIGAVSVEKDGMQVLKMASGEVAVSDYAPDAPYSSSVAFSDIEVNIAALEDRDARQNLQALGYEKLTGDMTATGVWDPNDGRLEINNMTFAVEEAGDISINLALDGYTRELMTAIQDMQEQDISAEAQGMAMMGLMQQLDIVNASISFTDASLTNRVLDFVAEQQGTNRAGIVAMAKGVIPFGLAQLQNPAFAQAATAAASQFLDDPQSITISAAPDTPVNVMQLMPAFMGQPQMAIDILKVTVTAK